MTNDDDDDDDDPNIYGAHNNIYNNKHTKYNQLV